MCVIAVYDNRLEQNNPIALFGPLTCSPLCVVDNILVQYYDKPPFTHGATLAKPLPLTCFGPPVIFPIKGGCLNPGTTLYASPCNLWNMKQMLVCGKPCYMKYAMALGPTLSCDLCLCRTFFPSVMCCSRCVIRCGCCLLSRNGGAEQFTQVLSHAVKQYHKAHGIPEKNQVQFNGADGTRVVQMAPAMEIER